MEQKYSMKAVAKITGLTPDTIRVWERRYQAVTPKREATGRRYYSDSEVERLMLLRGASELGMPIRQIAGLEDGELRRILAGRGETRAGGNHDEGLIEQMLKAVGDYDATELDRLLGVAAVSLPPRELAARVFFPLLRRVGDLWYEGSLSVAQEHMVSGRLRNFTGALMQFNPGTHGGETACFATLAGERHEFGALMCCWLTALRGWRSLYLGPDLPAKEIAAAAGRAGCSLVGLGAVCASGEKGRRGAALKELRAMLPGSTEIWLGGDAAEEIHQAAGSPDGVHIADLDSFLRRLDRGGAVRD